MHIWANEIKYPCDNIAPELLKNAKAVIRLNEEVFELISIKKSELRVKTVVTIMNERGYLKEFSITSIVSLSL